MEMRIVTMLRMMRTRKVHQLRKIARAQRAPPIKKRPTYHHALRSRTMYSSACQETSCDLFAINSLYHTIVKNKIK